MLSKSRLVLVIASLLLVPSLFAEGILIRCSRPCATEINAVKQAGGTVTHQYKHVDGIAAEIPASALPALQKVVGADRLEKDEMIPMPAPIADRDGVLLESTVDAETAVAVAPGAEAGAEPSNYPFNSQMTGVASLHASGKIGTGGIIAIIDSGFRPMFTHVAPSRVIAPGYNFVPGATEPPAISNLNGPHGTQVAGMAAANIGFCFGTGNRFVRAGIDLGLFTAGAPCAATAALVPMIGGAPGASIVPFKVFPAAGGSTPTSRTIQAMDKVLDLRLMFNANPAEGLNIKVVNLSLGGGTNSAGRGLSDLAVDRLLENDILPVISAGNSGHAGVTGGSPGTSMSALTVGAVASANHEWIYTAQFRGPCSSAPLAQVLNCAKTYRPDAGLQMSTFSSRGPTHDGRYSPGILANGSFDYTQGGGAAATTVGFVSGTSFSAPTVAGIAMTLRQAVPGASAKQVRNALLMSANPNLVAAAKRNDQGAGFIDAAAAYQLLAAGNVPDTVDLNQSYTRNLQANMSRAGVPVYTESASVHFSGIRPAETADVPFLVPANAAKLFVTVRNIVAESPAAEQNQFFGDDVHFKIQMAGVHRENYYAFSPNSFDRFLAPGNEYSYAFDLPAAGVWRIAPAGDWTNGGSVSFDVDVWTTLDSFPQHTASASIGHLQSHTYDIVVPAGTASLNARAEWLNMAASYPINDIDVTLVRPDNVPVFTCSTGNSPERCSVENPMAGTWKAVVEGFTVHPFGSPGGKEKYKVRIDADGTVLKPVN